MWLWISLQRYWRQTHEPDHSFWCTYSYCHSIYRTKQFSLWVHLFWRQLRRQLSAPRKLLIVNSQAKTWISRQQLSLQPQQIQVVLWRYIFCRRPRIVSQLESRQGLVLIYLMTWVTVLHPWFLHFAYPAWVDRTGFSGRCRTMDTFGHLSKRPRTHQRQ